MIITNATPHLCRCESDGAVGAAVYAVRVTFDSGESAESPDIGTSLAKARCLCARLVGQDVDPLHLPDIWEDAAALEE